MTNKVYCRFFPSCIDGDECLYEHGKANVKKREYGLCANGVECRDQSCKYNDKEHKKSKDLCRFQVNCNRLNCIYKHTKPRHAFLEEGGQISNKK